MYLTANLQAHYRLLPRNEIGIQEPTGIQYFTIRTYSLNVRIARQITFRRNPDFFQNNISQPMVTRYTGREARRLILGTVLVLAQYF